jgi:hypothetical protein
MGYLKKTYSLLGLEEMWKCSQELFMELQSGIYLIGVVYSHLSIWISSKDLSQIPLKNYLKNV